jgi:hypothetical protein
LLPGAERIHTGQTDEEDPEVELAWEAVLHPAIDRRGLPSAAAAAAVAAKLEALLDRLGGQMRREYLRQVGTLTFVPIRLRRTQLGDLQRFNPLRSIRPMPQMRRVPERRIRSVDFGAAEPEVPAERPPPRHRIAAFDGGR